MSESITEPSAEATEQAAEAPTQLSAPVSSEASSEEQRPRVSPVEHSVAAPLLSPTIRVRHLWHRFANRDVLRDVTFDVGAGEIFGFIGPNGAGKTTTIRVMATLLEPMAGRVEIDGIDVTLDPEAVRKVIGYMPDHAGVYDRITVREYLEFFADAFRVPSISVVDAVLELTDLGKLQDRLVEEMSKGMKQRLQLARILLHDPKVLILDEPASDLDPRARIEIRDLLLELKGLGKTIFLSSHILTELSDVCTSIGILERGRLVVAGPIHEISARLEAIRAAEAHGHAPPAPYMPPPVAASASASAPASASASAPAPAPAPVSASASASVPVPVPVPASAPVPAAPSVRRVKLRVLGNPEMAAYLLRGGPGIVDARVLGGVVNVGYTGTEMKIAEMVQHLVHRNIPIVGVEPERNELERIFLEVTRGDVQ